MGIVNDRAPTIDAHNGPKADRNDPIDAFADVAKTTAQGQISPPVSNEPVENSEEGDKQRIVVIRHTSSDESEIPFADYLGIETPSLRHDEGKSAG